MSHRHDIDKYGTSDYRGQAEADRQYQEQQARQREMDAQRAHQEQMERQQRSMNAASPAIGRGRQPAAQRRSTQQHSKANAAARAQAAAKGEDAFSILVFIAGGAAGLWLALIILELEPMWQVWGLAGLGAFGAHSAREAIRGLLKIAVIIGLGYLAVKYVLPGLAG